MHPICCREPDDRQQNGITQNYSVLFFLIVIFHFKPSVCISHCRYKQFCGTENNIHQPVTAQRSRNQPPYIGRTQYSAVLQNPVGKHNQHKYYTDNELRFIPKPQNRRKDISEQKSRTSCTQRKLPVSAEKASVGSLMTAANVSEPHKVFPNTHFSSPC